MDLNSFHAAMNRCGISVVGARNAIVDQGYENMEQFAELSESDIEKLVKHLSRLPAPVTIPFSAIKKLKAMRSWTKWRQRRAMAVVHAEFTQAMLDWTIGRMDDKKRIRDLEAEAPKEPDKLDKLSRWPKFWEAFDLYASQIRGTMSLPLQYVYRESAAVTPEILAATYPDTDHEMMAFVALDGEEFNTDNHHLWDLLHPLIKDGPGWVWIKRYERTKNARAAIAALKFQAEGRSATTSRKVKAYQTLAKAQYNGRSRRFGYDDYVKLLQTAFTELEECDEEVPESRKVDVFLRGLKASSLASTRAIIIGDPTKMASFNEAQLYVKTVMANMEGMETNDGPPHDRNVSDVKNDRNNKNGKGLKAELRTYSNKEWKDLGDAGRAKVRALRAKRNEDKKRKASEVDSDRQEGQEGGDGSPDGEDSPSAQFGRNAHNKKKSRE